MDVGMLPPMWSPAGGSNISSSNESLTWSHIDEEKYAIFKYLFFKLSEYLCLKRERSR